MEAKKHGTFKIDRSLTPKDNINKLLKQVYPVEVTVSKMNPEQFTRDGFYNRRGDDSIVLLKNIDVFPLDKYNNNSKVWRRLSDDATVQDKFARVGFGLKTNAKYSNRKGRDGYVARWSVPIIDEKVSISKVVAIFDEMQVITKEIDKYSAKREEEDRIRQEIQEAKALYVQEVNKLAGEHHNLRIDSQSYHDKMPAYFRVDVHGVTKAQAIAIGQAVVKIMNDPALMTPEIVDEEKADVGQQ
jgi:hypothetical protein